MTSRRRRMLHSFIALVAIALIVVALPGPVAAAGRGTPLPTLPQASTASQRSADRCDAVPGQVLVRFSPHAGRSDRVAARAAVHGRSLRSYRLVAGLELLS